MNEPELRVLMLARDDVERVKLAASELTAFLKSQPGVSVIEKTDWDDARSGPPPADVVVVLGGDGAILRACHQLGQHQLPILGVNLGRLGFLADLTPDDFREMLPRLKQRKFRVVEHLMFECELRRKDGSRQSFLGLNETIVCSANALQMIEVRLAIDDELVTTYSCDGLIISTPVGSTAHSLAAGGPTLRQNLQAFVITPICPHTLSNRPHVDHADCVYTLSLKDTSKDALLVVDGQHRLPLGAGDIVSIKRASETFKLVKLPGHSYYTTLQRKLGWSGQPIYPSR